MNNFLMGENTSIQETKIVRNSEKKFLLDSIDRKIISLLHQNGRMSNVDLASRVGLSPPPCLRRLKVLEEKKVITGYRAQINYGKLGYEVKALVVAELQSRSSEAISHFVKILKQLDNVISVEMTIDSLNLVISFISKNLEDYSLFLKKYVQDNRDVTSYKAYIIHE